MAEPIDLNQRRFERAKDCTEVDPATVLRETLRQIESGEWPITSITIVGVREDDGGTYVDTVHGGPATTNERIGMLARAMHTMFDV